jgi:MFS transporter, DHA3 family, macrolide efflux protein
MDSLNNNQLESDWKVRFFTIWVGQAFSILGSQIVQFALIWWLTRTTGSATILAMASLVGLLPQVILGPLAGALVDRWNRKVTMMAADGLVAFSTLILAILFFTGLVEIWHVFVLMFVRSAAGSFHWPAMQASTSLMVPNQHLSRIQGLNQTLNGGMSIAAAPLGALLIELLPMQSVLAVDIVTASIAILSLLFFKIPQPAGETSADAPAARTSVWQDFKAGLTYIWAWPGLMIIMVMAALINLVVGPGFALVPILVTTHFNGEAFQLAWMQSAFGIGMMAGGLLLSAWGGFKRRVLTSMVGLLGMAGGLIAIGLIPSSGYMAALVAMLMVGLWNPIVNGPLFAALQSCVAPQMQGRVFTLLLSAASAMMPIGLIIAGPLADAFGVQTWFIIGGVVTGAMAIVGLFIPAVMNFEQGRGESAAPLKMAVIPGEGD